MKLRVTMSVEYEVEETDSEMLKRQKLFFDRNPHRIMQLADLEDNYEFKVEVV